MIDPGLCPDDSLLAALIEGRLEPGAAEALRDHFSDCDSCRSIVSLGSELASEGAAWPAREARAFRSLRGRRIASAAAALLVAGAAFAGWAALRRSIPVVRSGRYLAASAGPAHAREIVVGETLRSDTGGTLSLPDGTSIGVLILLSIFTVSLQGRITQANSLHVELAGLYWHFVDIVWIVIFTLIYLIQP